MGGRLESLSSDDLVKAGVPVGTDPENLRGSGQGQEGPHESPHYSLTGVGIFLRVGGGSSRLGYLVKSW